MFSFPPCISLIIVERQNYFHRNFRLEKIFPEICNNMHLPIWNFKVTTNLPPSVFTCSFLNNIEYFFFRSKLCFSRYLTGSIFLLHPYMVYDLYSYTSLQKLRHNLHFRLLSFVHNSWTNRHRSMKFELNSLYKIIDLILIYSYLRIFYEIIVLLEACASLSHSNATFAPDFI